MNKYFNRLSVFLFFMDFLMVLLGLIISQYLRVLLSIGGPLTSEEVKLPGLVFVLAVLSWSGTLLLMKAYQPKRILRAVDEIRLVISASILSSILFAGTLYLSFRTVSRWQFIYIYFLITFLILIHRGLLRFYYRIFGRERRIEKRNILIVGAGDLGINVAEAILDFSRWGYDLVGFLDDDPGKLKWYPETCQGRSVLGKVDDLVYIVDKFRIHEVYIALPTRAFKRINDAVLTLQSKSVNIKIVPDYFSLAMIHAHPERLAGLPVVSLRNPVIGGAPRLVKRLFDISISLILLLLIWPIMLLIALLIRLDSPGKVIFKQKRVGEDGIIFNMYKFRTMYSDAEKRMEEVIKIDEEGNIIHKSPDDPRITKVGNVLRKLSLDELPQLFNVLFGDMSLVGPRPELPWLVEKYQPWQRKRFAVPQGITGWWQVNKRSDHPMHLSTEDDLYYVYNYSLWLDIKILLLTIPAVLSRKGAY